MIEKLKYYADLIELDVESCQNCNEELRLELNYIIERLRTVAEIEDFFIPDK